MRFTLRSSLFGAAFCIVCWGTSGCSTSTEPETGKMETGKMGGAMDKMETGKMGGAMDKMETGKMGGAMDKMETGKMDTPKK